MKQEVPEEREEAWLARLLGDISQDGKVSEETRLCPGCGGNLVVSIDQNKDETGTIFYECSSCGFGGHLSTRKKLNLKP